jgi:hypothetical protein
LRFFAAHGAARFRWSGCGSVLFGVAWFGVAWRSQVVRRKAQSGSATHRVAALSLAGYGPAWSGEVLQGKSRPLLEVSSMTTTTNNLARGAQNAGEVLVKENGGLVRVAVHLRGDTPLLMNAMSQEQLLDLWHKRKPSKTAARPDPREWADTRVYRLHDGRPCIPPKNLMASFIAAGKFIRLDGRRQVSTNDSTVLPGMLQIEDIHLPVFAPETENPARWEVDLQQGRNPNGGEAVCIIRPRFDEWEVRCVLEIDQEEMPLPMAKRLVTLAGRRMGLGDGRPQRKLTFGRYSITLWKSAD